MAGKLTNIKYDEKVYREESKRILKELNYRINSDFITNKNDDDTEDKIDVDSILRGLKTKEPIEIIKPKDKIEIENNYSRYLDPIVTTKGKNRNLRLDYPLEDPQCNIIDLISVNTRLEAKDNYIAPWIVPMDQSNFLNKN